jgi:CubicO group peptidase (beta-lactamase class C family)
MKARLIFSTILLGLFLAAPLAALADPLPTAAPESVGLSKERLGRITETFQASIAKGDIPGVVLLISRKGKVAYFEAMGSLDPEKKTPMTRDGIFRIYSMTKPIATVAAMMLFEEGKLALSDPVAKHIPAFKDVKVGVEKPGPDGKPTLELVPAQRPMTVHDLMRHSAGLTYGFFGTGAVKKAYLDANLYEGAFTNADFAERLAKLPLAFQPGTTWDYSHSTDVLGRVVEVVSGKSLYQFMKERLLDPLGMTDTMFHVANDPARQARLAEPFANDRSLGAGIAMSDPRIATKDELGGQGMVGTAADYARFLQMLANGGTLDGKRYLSPRTIAYMTSDHMGDVVKRGPFDLLGPGYKFGLGFGVRTDTGLAPYAGSAGDYHWGGAGGTAFWVDPQEKMFVVFMMQAPSKRLPYRIMLRNMVYAAIVE